MNCRGIVSACALALALFALTGCPDAPRIDYSPRTLRYEPGETQKTLEIWNAGLGGLDWALLADDPWVTFEPGSGSSSGPGDITEVTVSINGEKSAFYKSRLHIVTRQGRRFVPITTAPDPFTERFNAHDNDLRNLSVTFTPTGGYSFYEAAVTPDVHEFPADTTGATDLTGFLVGWGEDPYKVTLQDGKSVQLYGNTYTSLWVGSDGYVAFRKAGVPEHRVARTDFSLAEHFRLPGVSGFFANLAPTELFSVNVKQFDDRVAVTWDDVPEAGRENSNSFQVEMFHDGDIRLTWLGMDATQGIAGLSGGMMPDPFVSSDLSAYPVFELEP